MKQDMAAARTVIAAFLVFYALAVARQPAFADAPIDTVVVVVQDQTGMPLPFADVATGLQSLLTHFSADAQGRASWSFGGRSSSYTIDRICAIYPPGVSPTHTTCSGPVTISPGETRTVTLVVDISGSGDTAAPSPAPSSSPDRGWILGAVSLTGPKTPVAGATIVLGDTPLRARSEADGRYQFPAISTTDGADGGPTYTVSVTPPPGYAWSAQPA
jgi:hypothetical protein